MPTLKKFFIWYKKKNGENSFEMEKEKKWTGKIIHQRAARTSMSKRLLISKTDKFNFYLAQERITQFNKLGLQITLINLAKLWLDSFEGDVCFVKLFSADKLSCRSGDLCSIKYYIARAS